MGSNYFEAVILGLVQGLAEWLPVSSEGMIVLTKTIFFPDGGQLTDLIRMALLLHLGTFFAALLYFGKDVAALLKTFFSAPVRSLKEDPFLRFLVLTTLISGVLGFGLLKTLENIEDSVDLTGRWATGLVGALLIGTGLLQIFFHREGDRPAKDARASDTWLLGLAQGLAALPGFSRSGLTLAALFLRKFKAESALKMSFMMSLPITLAGNILLNFKDLSGGIGKADLLAVATAFVSGYICIFFLMKLAVKIPFGLFVLVFGLLTVVASLI